MTAIKARPEYQHLTEQEVKNALHDPDPANPIAIEIARLLEGYTENFRRSVEREGKIPTTILRAKGGCPIEEIAMQLLTDEIKAMLK